MEVNIYSIYDKVAKVFNKPFTEFNDDTAKRAFMNSIAENPNYLDYSLYHLGWYSDQNGEVSGMKEPTKIATGHDHKNNALEMIQKQAC